MGNEFYASLEASSQHLPPPYKEQQRKHTCLQTSWSRAPVLGDEALLSYDVNTNLWRSSYTLPLSLFPAYCLSWVCFTPWHHLGGCDTENRGCPPKSPVERISLEQPLVVEELGPSSPPSTTSSPLLRTPILLSSAVPLHAWAESRPLTEASNCTDAFVLDAVLPMPSLTVLLPALYWQ